jgi:hypothetical protein
MRGALPLCCRLKMALKILRIDKQIEFKCQREFRKTDILRKAPRTAKGIPMFASHI